MNGEGPREPETEVSEGGSISSFDASSAIGSFDASSDEEGGNGDSGDSSGTVKSAVPRIAQEITAESAQEGKEHGDDAHQFQGQSARTINAKDTNQGPHPIRSRSAGRLGIFMDFHAHLHEEDKQRRTHNTRLRRTVLFFRGEIEEIQLILQNKRERHRKQIRRRSRQGEMVKELNHDGVSSTSEFDVTMDKFVTKADKNQAKNIKNTLYQTASTLDGGFTFVKNLYSDEKARRNYETRLQALCQKLERREWFDTFMLLVVIASTFVLLFLDTQDKCRDLGALRTLDIICVCTLNVELLIKGIARLVGSGLPFMSDNDCL